MKIEVKATHRVLPDVNELVDSDVLSDKMGELVHMGYDIKDEAALTEIEMNVFDGHFDETPVMCADCCETTVKCRLTDIESCPSCGSPKMFEIE
jgi:hypothetical protein